MSIITRGEENYWTQVVSCERNSTHKFDYIYSLATGKTLHVGCTDYPLENSQNLHKLMHNDSQVVLLGTKD